MFIGEERGRRAEGEDFRIFAVTREHRNRRNRKKKRKCYIPVTLWQVAESAEKAHRTSAVLALVRSLLHCSKQINIADIL